jgi:hypothetical protein
MRGAKLTGVLRWLPSVMWQRLSRPMPEGRRIHLIIAVADHFEPAIVPEDASRFADISEQQARLNRWVQQYPAVVGTWRDSDGFPLRHTYFYPAEQYEKSLLDVLAEHCRDGWGEVEVHLHHGVHSPATSDGTRELLLSFRNALAEHGCLSVLDGKGPPRYAFVHGNWALANSAGGRWCGVDDELQILSETGCYADLTLPSAPAPGQISKVNSLYECRGDLARRAAHRRGRDLRRGQRPRVFPLIIQGPLGIDIGTSQSHPRRLRIDNGEITTQHPATIDRLRLWRRSLIRVHGTPDWLFIKLHCHGMDPRDEDAMLGAPIQRFLRDIAEVGRSGGVGIHFVTAREMTNIVLAACDGQNGDPGSYRDYRLRAIHAHSGRRRLSC